MSKSKQENIDPAAAVAQEEKKRKDLLFSFSAKFIAAVGSTEGSRNSCLLTDAIALFDKDWDEGIDFYVREIGCRNIPELVQLLKNKVRIFMDAQKRWWVNVLRTDVNGHILDRVDSANERNRIESYNRSTGAGRSTTNYIPLKNEQAFRDFRRGRLSLSNGFPEPNPFNRSAPPAPLRSLNRSVPPAPARNQKQAAPPPVPAQNTNQTKNSNRAARRSRQRRQYERPRAFSLSTAKNGSNSSSNTSIFNSSMPPPRQPQPLFPKKTPEPVQKQKQQPSKPSTTLTQSDNNKQTEVAAAELIGVFSNSSLGPANPEANNGANVPAVPPVKSSAPTACTSNDSIDSTRAKPAANNGVNSPVNIAKEDEKEKKAKFAEEMRKSGNELSDRLGQLQISAKDQTVAPTKPAFSLPMKRIIDMDTSVLDALEAPLPGADEDIEIRAPLPHVDDDIDEDEVDW